MFFIKRAHFFDLNSKTKSIFIPMKQKYKPWVQTSYGLTATANARQDVIIIRLSKHLTQALWGSHWYFVMLLCRHRKISNFRDNYLRENPELLKQLLIGHVQKYDNSLCLSSKLFHKHCFYLLHLSCPFTLVLLRMSAIKPSQSACPASVRRDAQSGHFCSCVPLETKPCRPKSVAAKSKRRVVCHLSVGTAQYLIGLTL